jgi:hypothetical protein
VEALSAKIKGHNFKFGENWIKGESIMKSDYGKKSVKLDVDMEARKDLRSTHW